MDRLTPQRLTELLKEVDHKGMFQKHKAGFGRTPSIRPVVDRTTTQITVRLSSKLRTLPEEAVRETFENVMARIYDPDLPRFGPRAVSHMQSEAFIKDVHRQLMTTQRFKTCEGVPANRLGGSVRRVRKLLPDPSVQLSMSYLDMGWRQEAFSLADEFIASTDALAQCIRVDARLSLEEMPTILLDYVVFRELVVLCTFDHRYGRVDTDRYEELAGRFPDGDTLSRLCEELGWAFTVPVEGEGA